MRSTSRLPLLALAAMLAVPVVPAVGIHAAQARVPGSEGFADLAGKLLPGVVNISSTSTAHADRQGGPGGGPEVPVFPPGSPFEQFFKDFMDRNRRGQGGGGQGQNDTPDPGRKMQSLGSGFVIDPSGIVITNNHVIDGADEITVLLQDNTSFKAKLLGKDARADVAVLKITSDKPLVAVPFGDSDKSRVGDVVLAIGNPFGLGGSVSAGIVSARGRDIHQGPYDDYIQTDAAINRGNSGGPLFNMDGEVIGINTAIYSPSGGSVGIGFSIPSNLAKNVVAQIRDFGRARRGWLGVQIQQVTPDIAESVGLHDPSGALVAGISGDGPAAKAQLRGGDIILRFNNQDVKEMRTLPRIVADTEIGKQVPVTVWRDGHAMPLTAVVGELPEDPKEQLASASPDRPAFTPSVTELSGLGMKVGPLTADSRGKYQLGADQKGVVITDVTSGTPAADRGLKPGDVIVEVQQEAVSTPDDVLRRIDNVRKANRQSVLMLVQNSDGLRWVPLSLKADNTRKPG